MKIVSDKKLQKAFDEIRQTPGYRTERVKLDVTESLVEAMEAQGLSKAELADRLGTSRAYITKVLNGNVNFTLETLVRLSLALEVELVGPNFLAQGLRKPASKSSARKAPARLHVQKR